MEIIRGEIQKVNCSKGSWASLAIMSDKGEYVRAAGSVINPQPNFRIEAEGDFVIDPKFGRQFKVTKAILSPPETADGIVAYLSSGFVKGVGPTLARAIVRQFGTNTYKIIETNPDLLKTVSGISQKKMEEIVRVHAENKVYRELYEYLNGSVTSHQVEIIYEKYGTEALKVIRENPYRLIYELDGIGFKKADKLALAAGLKRDSLERVSAALVYILMEITSAGHCYLTISSLEENVQTLINENLGEEDKVPLERIADAIILGVNQRRIVVDGERLYHSRIYEAECSVAEYLGKMLRKKAVKIDEISIVQAIGECEDRTHYEFDNSQKEAVKLVLNNRVSAITGGPGTGKTTIQQVILAAWGNRPTLLMAPTGKASRRMAEVTNYPAGTIHRSIKECAYIKGALILVDEASMIDITLAADLLRTFSEHNQIVFIGDVDQLPPIGPGNFFRDLLLSCAFPSCRLTFSYRSSSTIAKNAMIVNSGKSCSLFLEDETFRFEKPPKEEAGEAMIDAYLSFVGEFGVKNVVCLVPMKNRTVTASVTLNEIIREKMNPVTSTNVIPECKFRVGDRVMQLENNSKLDIYNGDVGMIEYWDEMEGCLGFVTDDGREATFAPKACDSLTFAYAMTIHKSQGSEYKGVVISQGSEHYIMLQRQLLYTALTRASEKIVLVGSSKAVNISIGAVKAIQRNTILRERLASQLKP